MVPVRGSHCILAQSVLPTLLILLVTCGFLWVLVLYNQNCPHFWAFDTRLSLWKNLACCQWIKTCSLVRFPSFFFFAEDSKLQQYHTTVFATCWVIPDVCGSARDFWGTCSCYCQFCSSSIGRTRFMGNFSVQEWRLQNRLSWLLNWSCCSSNF